MRSIFAGAMLLATMATTASAQTVTSVFGAPDPFASNALFSNQNMLLSFSGCAAAPTGIVITGGACKTTSSSGQWAQPAQSYSGGGYYTTTGPYSPSSMVTIDFSGWLAMNNASSLTSLSLYWGSIDTYNTLNLLDANNNVLATITGGSIPPANGNQSASSTNRRVNIDFGLTGGSFRKLQFVSTQAAFEFDDIAVQTVVRGSVVPEPSTVVLLAGGLGLIGFVGSRRKRNSATQV